MNIFANGEFRIENSWNKPASKQSRRSSQRSASKENNSFVNAARKLIEPTPDILDQEMSKKIYKEFRAQIPPLPGSCRSEKKIGSREGSRNKLPPRQKTNNQSEDLLTSMASRLKQVEQACKSQRKELSEKNATIDKLKHQNHFLKGFRENSQSAYKKFEKIENQNKELQEKVAKMEEYLKKYGLKWVGNYKVQGSLDHKKMKKDIANSKHNYRLPSQIDLATIQRRIQDLNAGLHSQGQGTQIYSQNGVHKMRKAEPLPMAFFGDGIAIKGFNFYPYKSKQSLKILSDLIDGYFPYVLKGKYPNGVFLEVIDKIAEKYSNQAESEIGKVGSLNEMAKKQFEPESKEQFLNKLPKEIIKNGKVIPIRGEISKKLDGIQEKQENYEEFCEQKNGCFVFKTPTHAQVQSSECLQSQICTLKIRTEDGKIFILELQQQASVQQVYRWMGKVVDKKFKLMGNYPKREYPQTEKQNLQQLELTPNAILHIQIIR